MYPSTTFALLGASFFGFARFTALFTSDNLEKAIAVNANVSISVRVHRRFPFRHKHPIFALYVRRQPGAGHSCQP
jgi:hypothetical protein